MRRSAIALSLVALLGACGQSAAPPPPQRTIKVQGDEQRQLAAANKMDRAIALKRAIYDAGSRCRRVVDTAQMADYKNLSMWQAVCDDGGNWAIYVGPNGGVQVRACADLKGLKLPQCTLPAAARAPAKSS